MTRRPPTYFIFGCNTNVGKTVLAAGLVRAAAAGTTAADSSSNSYVHYIKPLQCGGSDEAFVRKYCPSVTSATTLFRWETPASPHLAARMEGNPISDIQAIDALTQHLQDLEEAAIKKDDSSDNVMNSSIWIETAGGVLSPAASSPDNNSVHIARNQAGWGWVPQADLYRSLATGNDDVNNADGLRIPVVLVGDGRLGGISATIAALEALLVRNYEVAGILQIRGSDTGAAHVNEDVDTNQEALQEYVFAMAASKQWAATTTNNNIPLSPLWADPDKSIVSLPALPPEPEPLDKWYASQKVRERLHTFVHDHLFRAS